jgi:hypothetical protein
MGRALHGPSPQAKPGGREALASSPIEVRLEAIDLDRPAQPVRLAQNSISNQTHTLASGGLGAGMY